VSGHHKAIYVHGGDKDFAPVKREPKPAPKVQHPYCEVHHTYFCPCVKPGMYKGNLAKARKEWDDELKKKKR